jgi:hypothetical protein
MTNLKWDLQVTLINQISFPWSRVKVMVLLANVACEVRISCLHACVEEFLILNLN